MKNLNPWQILNMIFRGLIVLGMIVLFGSLIVATYRIW